MTPDLLRAIGEAYPGGQRGLAQWLGSRLGKESETMRKALQRYESGANALPEWLSGELRVALAEHVGLLRHLRRKLR